MFKASLIPLNLLLNLIRLVGNNVDWLLHWLQNCQGSKLSDRMSKDRAASKKVPLTNTRCIPSEAVRSDMSPLESA